MKEILPISMVFAFIVICCTLIANRGSLTFLGMEGSTLAVMAGIGAIISMGYFLFRR